MAQNRLTVFLLSVFQTNDSIVNIAFRNFLQCLQRCAKAAKVCLYSVYLYLYYNFHFYSLVNIFKEVKREYPEFVIPNHGELIGWAKQGIYCRFC